MFRNTVDPGSNKPVLYKTPVRISEIYLNFVAPCLCKISAALLKVKAKDGLPDCWLT